jgi:hypothetical protein
MYVANNLPKKIHMKTIKYNMIMDIILNEMGGDYGLMPVVYVKR